MSYNRELIEGLLAALLSVLIVGGGIGLSLAEDEMSALGISSPTEPVPVGFEPASSPIPNPSPPPLATEIALQQEPTATSVTVIQASITVTVLPTSTSCSYPLGWFRITVGAGETLESIAQLYNTTPAELSQGNCLLTQTIRPGSILYVPEPPPTEVSEACGPPSGWVFYTVQPGDTLSGIGAAFGVDVSDLQFANCMGNSTLIRVGQNIFVPNVPTNTPEDSPTPTATRKPRATRTNTPRPTATPTPTPRTVIPPTDTPTNTPQPSPSATPQPSLTFTNTPVPSDTPSPTATHTPTFTLTFTPTFTPTPSSTPTPENSPTPTIEQTLPILTLTPTSTQAEEGWFTYGGYDR